MEVPHVMPLSGRVLKGILDGNSILILLITGEWLAVYLENLIDQKFFLV